MANTEKNESFASYNVIRQRLLDRSKELWDTLSKINEKRIEIYGESQSKILKNENILTENSCIPRDIFAIGNRIILGYNVHMGLKTNVTLNDVFSSYVYKDGSFEKTENTIFKDEKFLGDFQDLYKYYKESFFAKFFQRNGYLYMVFQNGNDYNNIKTFKWFIKDEELEYHGNRSNHEVIYDAQEEILWKRTTRENQINGAHPHISIEDKVFVETIGGDLTLKIEDNTNSGEGIYFEPVENKDQKLDDAEISYAIVGNLILLKIRPYQENTYRYLVFNEKTKEVFRVDSIERACILLPENQGLLVPNGIIRQSGGFTKFEIPFDSSVFQEKRASINGEDFEYVFYNFGLGEYYIYSYNIINSNANPPLIVSGFARFPNGHLVIIKAEKEAKKNHTLQIWETSFSLEEKINGKTENDSFLGKLGNKTLVRAIAEMTSLYRLIKKEDSYYSLYIDIVKDCETIMNSYFWLDKEEVFGVKTFLLNIKEAASIAVKEFEKINKIKEANKKQNDLVEEKVKALLKQVNYKTFEEINDYVDFLSKLREIRGEVASLKDLDFANLVKVELLGNNIKEANDKISIACVDFLLKDDSLKLYVNQVEECSKKLESIQKVVDGKELEAKIVTITTELELLINIVNSLKIEDTTKSAEIIDKISELFSHLNQIRSKLLNIINNFDSKERKSEFYSKLNLIANSVSNYLGLCQDVEKVDSYLNKLIVQLDELESKFSDFDEFIPQLSEKREEIVSAFTTKKQNLVEAKNKKINSLFDAAERVFKGLENRLKTLEEVRLINEIFTSDLMVEKLRDIIDNLISLGDATKASEIESRLKAMKENAIRQLKDKKELFVDGNTIKFGKNNFLVTEEISDLTILRKENDFYFHISATDFWEKIPRESIIDYERVWEQEIVSENREVYRGEFLAYKILRKYKGNSQELYTLGLDSIKTLIKETMEQNYDEYYTKGVHDNDALVILKEIIAIYKEAELAIYSPRVRAMAMYFYYFAMEKDEKELLIKRLKSLYLVSKHSNKSIMEGIIPFIEEKVENFYKKYPWFNKENIKEISHYFSQELSKNDNFVLSYEANELYKEFNTYLNGKNAKADFNYGLNQLKDDFEGAYIFINEWINVFLTEINSNYKAYREELLSLCLFDDYEKRRKVKLSQSKKIEGLLGVHPLIENSIYKLELANFLEKLELFYSENSKIFNQFQKTKTELLNNMRGRLKFHQFKASVLTSFVRNKLINEVYLPLIGDNFAKQIGVAGKDKRTDNMGMLLLISPPGYGKTTLIEYISARLNMLLVKINCPTLGHKVTSLDPAEAPNATAREELEKLNLAFEMGNNVIIYLDDIQHSNPEFLQKFISLCDGQRKVEGIYKGQSKTYSFRGKKVAVVMAGNPYTESGEKFQIPDMLSNRADVYNLGDMLRENEEAFKLSYLENAMTSNSTLNKIYMKNQEDVYKLISAVRENNRENLELSGTYTESDIEEYWNLIKALLSIRDEILRVNMEYIASAAQNDKYRTEPPFKLQGSYRNMNKITEKLSAVMNENEVRALISKAYESDAQTLASDAEASLLKFKEITNRFEESSRKRWEEIKSIYLENKRNENGDRVVQVVEGLNKIGFHMNEFSKFLEEFMKNR